MTSCHLPYCLECYIHPQNHSGQTWHDEWRHRRWYLTAWSQCYIMQFVIIMSDGLETSIVLLQHYLQLINFRRELRMAQCAMEVSQLQPPSDYISKCKLRLRSCFHCRGESAHAASVLFWCADKQIQRLRAKAVASDLSDAGFHHSPLFPQDN